MARGPMTLDAQGQDRAPEAGSIGSAEFRHLLECAPDAIVICDVHGRVVLANRMVEALFGYTPEALQGQPVEVLLPERLREAHLKHRAHYAAAPRTRRMGEGRDLWARRRDGSEFPVEISLSPFVASQGLLITAVIRDVSEAREIQTTLTRHTEELARSNAELEQFAYVASHDLQEPLRMLASYAQLLSRRYGDKLDSDASDFIHFIVDGATRMQDLINDLLAYARVGTRGSELVPTDTNEVVKRALRQIEAAIEQSRATFHVHPLPTVLADEKQLVQVFQNLFANAIKFCRGATPHIEVSACEKANAYHISVRDNGIGIEPQYHARIFLLFQRLHSRGDYAGTGIGLAICKKIVERHGGHIWVESSPGQGSTFSFSLPKGGEAVQHSEGGYP